MPASPELIVVPQDGASGHSYVGAAVDTGAHLGGASQLICRIRPCEKPSALISVQESNASIEVSHKKGQAAERVRFDHILNARNGNEQEELFERIRPAIAGCLQGHGCTVVAHGGPQSGKSYTLSGFFTHGQLHGLAPRAIQFIVEILEQGAQTGSHGLPAVEASFFELQHDCVCDLLVRGCPQVGFRETAEFPFCIVDSALTAHRCDGTAGFNRLLDTYFTGLEHRRRGAHTCFQIAFSFPDGRPQSFLRFVEMAWPRSSTSANLAGRRDDSHRANKVPAFTAAAKDPPQGRAAHALEQVLHSKISNGLAAPASYQSSPLALLFKPCFEGVSLLYFIHCLRLEQVQQHCLLAGVPLVTKLEAWLGMLRGREPNAEALAHAVPVPTGSSAAPVLTGASSLSSSSSRACAKAFMRPTDKAFVGAGAAGSSVAATTPEPEEAGNHADPSGGSEAAAEDSWVLQHCSDLLEAKKRSYDNLRADHAHSSAVLRDVDTLLGKLRGRREVERGGPDERETNLKMLSEKLHRSLQRTSSEIQCMQEDIEVLSRFCGSGVVPPAYDSYNVKQEDVDKIVQHKQDAKVVEAPQRGKVVVPQLQLGLLPKEHVRLGPPTSELRAELPSCRSSEASSSDAAGDAEEAFGSWEVQHGQTTADHIAAALTREVVVPQLPLDLLPQEHPQLQPMMNLDTGSRSSSSFDSSVASPAAGATGGVSASLQPKGCSIEVRPVLSASHSVPYLIAPPPHVLQQQQFMGRAASMAALPMAVTPPVPLPVLTTDSGTQQTAVIRCVSPLAAASRGLVNPRGSNLNQGVRKSHSTTALRSVSVAMRPPGQLVQQPVQGSVAAPGFASPALGPRDHSRGGTSPLRCASTATPSRPVPSTTAAPRPRPKASQPNSRLSPPIPNTTVGWQGRGLGPKHSSPSPERQRVAAAASPLRATSAPYSKQLGLQPSGSTPCLPSAGRLQSSPGAWAATGVAAEVAVAAGPAALGTACAKSGWSSPPGPISAGGASIQQAPGVYQLPHASPTWQKR